MISAIVIAIFVFLCLLIVVRGVVVLIRSKKHFAKKKKEQLSPTFEEMIDSLIEPINRAKEDYDLLLGENRGFCMHSQVDRFKEQYEKLYLDCKFIPSFFITWKTSEVKQQLDMVRNFQGIYDNFHFEAKRYNEQWIQNQLALHQSYFDNMFAYPLDEQQRRAILSLDDHTLVVASAGSGKTSTIMGRTRYLKEKYGVPESNILLVTYTHKAAEEMKSRLNCRDIEACTFHSLALKIIGQATHKKQDICKPYFFKEVMNNLLKTTSYKKAMIDYVMLYKNLVKNEHDYDTPSEIFADRRKYGFQAEYLDMDGHIIFTKSEQERQICNLLGIWGVRFRYEAPYEVDLCDEEHRQYKPDFTIYFINAVGEEAHFYLEHFALSHGHVPKYFGQIGDSFDGAVWQEEDAKYIAGVEWKRGIHKKYHTVLVETTSEDFYNGTVKEKLLKMLKSRGVTVCPLNIEKTYDQLIKRDKYIERQVMDLVETFISLMKAKRFNIDSLEQISTWQRTTALLKILIKPAYEEYEHRLKEQNLIDFTDAILQATDILRQGYQIPWTDILVDEYQDIAIDRYEFLKELHRSGTRLFCVGDDWQSIYRFSGSDINLMNHFESWFPKAQICKMENTHRFGQPLVAQSSRFIQANPSQLKKDITCGENQTELHFISYDVNSNELFYAVSRIVKSIPKEESIYILARYRFDAESLNIHKNVQYDLHLDKAIIQIEGRSVQFLTVHSAKGLEADHVILINCTEKYFPSQITDDPILDNVLSQKESYVYAEERRVFYVAITRAKKDTYVLYNREHPSEFVGEFIELDKTDDRELCPFCHIGHIKVMRSGITRIGHSYQFVVCDNNKMGCPFRETRYFNPEGEKNNRIHRQPARRIRTSEMRKAGYFDNDYTRTIPH